MPGKIEIKVTTEWREVEADGDQCIVCGLPCFLKQFVLFIKPGSNRWERLCEMNVCQACFDYNA